MMKKKEILTKAQRRATFLWFVLGVLLAPAPSETQVEVIEREVKELVDKDGKEID